jgi:hypothetical protein
VSTEERNAEEVKRFVERQQQAIPSKLEIEAEKALLKELTAVRESFSPSKPIEDLLVLAFTRGACWALNIDIEAALKLIRT